jgi:hypothetical protein
VALRLPIKDKKMRDVKFFFGKSTHRITNQIKTQFIPNVQLPGCLPQPSFHLAFSGQLLHHRSKKKLEKKHGPNQSQHD